MPPVPRPGQRIGPSREDAARQAAVLGAALVPADIVERVSKEELAARIAYAQDLSAAAQGATDRTIRQGYRDLATAVLKARPRDEVSAQHRALTDRANAMPAGPERDRVARQAQQLLDENPQAPDVQASSTGQVNAGGTRAIGTQPVAKTAADGKHLVRVHDEHGCLTHVVDPDHLIPLAGAGCRQPDGVAKAASGGPKPQPPGSRGKR